MRIGQRLVAGFTQALALLGRGGKRPSAARGLHPVSDVPGAATRGAATPQAGRHTSAGPLLGMGALAVLFLGVVLLQTWCWTCRHIDDTAGRQAHLAVEFGKSLRNYVGQYVRPEMEKRVAPGEFIPEAMSTSFIARSVLEDVRQAFPDTILRFAARNPRNPINQATPAEETLIQYFEQHPDKDLWSGTMEFFAGGEKYFVCAIPRRFEASCLKCHGQPADAPAALLARYGAVAGFGRSVGEISVDLAAVPVSASYAAARAQVARHMLIALGLCLLFLGGIASLIRADAQRWRRAERAVSDINQELREFAYIISHDLKAPLRAIRTLADWLKADYADKLDAEGKEHLTLLASRVNRMQNLIDGVLQYSRIGRTEQGTVPVDLAQVVPEVIENLGVPEHVAVHIENDLPTVDADPTRITQVFQNLLSNAIKYMDKPQGRVTIACAEQGSFWQFRVSDNGPGIEAKDFERIFKLFQTLGRRDDGESTGIGLTIAKKIVELYGGRIWVESEVGQGSTFFFTFPKRSSAVAAEPLQTCAIA